MVCNKIVLVVDDDPDIVESITILLESAGYKVKSADCGHRCFEILRYVRPDLIILDVMLDRVVEGFLVASELKSNPEYRSIPIVMVSAIENCTGFTVDKEFLRVEEFIQKPVIPRELITKIKKLIA